MLYIMSYNKNMNGLLDNQTMSMNLQDHLTRKSSPLYGTTKNKLNLSSFECPGKSFITTLEGTVNNDNITSVQAVCNDHDNKNLRTRSQVFGRPNGQQWTIENDKGFDNAGGFKGFMVNTNKNNIRGMKFKNPDGSLSNTVGFVDGVPNEYDCSSLGRITGLKVSGDSKIDSLGVECKEFNLIQLRDDDERKNSSNIKLIEKFYTENYSTKDKLLFLFIAFVIVGIVYCLYKKSR